MNKFTVTAVIDDAVENFDFATFEEAVKCFDEWVPRVKDCNREFHLNLDKWLDDEQVEFVTVKSMWGSWIGGELKIKSQSLDVTNSGDVIKITKAGYLYINSMKVSERRLTPLFIPENISEEAIEKVRAWVSKNWKMC